MSKILDNNYVWVFLVKSESTLLVALVKYVLCSHFTQNCIILYHLEAKTPCFLTKNCWKYFYICLFILSKKLRNWFYKTLHNSGIVGCRKLADPLLNCIFNALSIGVQHTYLFQYANFGLRCLFNWNNPSSQTYWWLTYRHVDPESKYALMLYQIDTYLKQFSRKSVNLKKKMI